MLHHRTKMDYLEDFTERLYLFSLGAITKHHILSGVKRLDVYFLSVLES